MSAKIMKKLQLSLLLALCQLAPAHAYEVDATGKILWKYYDGKTVNGSTGNASYGPRGEILGASNGFPVYSSTFATVPALTAPATLYGDLNSKINFTLRESRNINQSNIVLSGDDQTNLKIAPGKEIEVWATFYSEGAGYENSVGFFTYDPLAPPSRDSTFVNTLRTEQIIFPRASSEWPMPSVPVAGTAPAPAPSTGTTVYLGKFAGGANGKGLGFFVAANGWNDNGRTLNNKTVGGVKEAQDKGWIFYSLKALNPETSVGNLNQHTVMVQDSVVKDSANRQYQRLVFGFEDVRRDLGGSDNDFNDVMMVLHASSTTPQESPLSAISNLANLPQLASATTADTDGDGVNDNSDEFPKDATKAYSLWYPGSGSYGTLAYEDQWPNKGDYDFNDIVVRYRSRQVLNAQRQVKGLEMDLRLDARGGIDRSGFALAMPGILPSQIKSGTVTLTRNGVAMPNPQLTSVTGEGGGAVFEIFADALVQMPVDGVGDAQSSCLSKQFRNTGQGCPINDFVAFKLSFDLINATATFPLPPYDPFIFNASPYGGVAAKGIEIHLQGKQPTSRADKSLFNTGLDYRTVASNGTYVNSYGTKPAAGSTLGSPWALDIPIVWDYPYEGLKINLAYPDITAWITSGGTTNPSWYLSPKSVSSTFRNGR